MLWIFSFHILDKLTHKSVLRPPPLLFSHFVSLIKFEASAFILISFRLGNILELGRFDQSICVYWVSVVYYNLGVFFILKVGFIIRLNIPLGIVLKVVFMCVPPLFKYLSYYLLSNGIGIPVLRNHSKSIQCRGKRNCFL